MSARIRPARPADFLALAGELPPWRVRAFTAEDDGKVLGVGGLAFLPDGTVGAFVTMSKDGKRYPITLHKAGLRTMNEAQRLKLPRVVALADPSIGPARRWLSRLGFRPFDIEGQEVWIWLTPSR